MRPAARKRQLKLDQFDVTLIRSQRKTLSLEVNREGIRVRAPLRMPQAEIERFVRLKADWLRRHIAALPQRAPAITLKQGARIQLNGKPYTLQLTPGRGQISITESTIMLPLQSSHLSQHESARRKLVRELKQYAAEQFQAHGLNLAANIQPQLKPPKIKVREYKKRWGSCDQRGNISVNWRLIQAPLSVQRYVIVHELTHRQEFNHSRKFWDLVADYDATWQASQQWLQDHGADLYRF